MFLFQSKTNVYDHQYSKELRDIIKSDSLRGIQQKHFSYILDKALTQSGVGEILEIINCVLTFIEVVFYIVSTYTYPEINNNLKKTNEVINIIEMIFLIYFIFHFVLRFYTCQSRFFFFFDLPNLIDLSFIICIIISRQNILTPNDTYFMRMFRMVRFCYLFRIESILQKRTNEQFRYAYKLIISLITIIFLSTAIILEVENRYTRSQLDSRKSDPNVARSSSKWEIYQFHDVVYFEFVTLTTIGFGDLTPKSDLGRLGTICTIVIIIAVIPALYSKMSIVFSLSSTYSRQSYNTISRGSKHLVILGDCGPESYEACLQELYHEDHGNTNFDTIIMQTEPNDEMIKMIKRNNYGNRVYYLVGNSLNHIDLQRCKSDLSMCVIILANKLVSDQRQEDFNNIMKAFSIKNFACMKTGEPKTRLSIQLLLPQTKDVYYSSLLSKKDINFNAQIICVEELKLQMLGKSCLCPGINTIIASLITSQKPSTDDIEENIPVYFNWYQDYLEGLGNEIYCIKLKSEILHNLTFIDLVRLIYELIGFIVIGTDVIFEDLDPFVCLNPSYAFSPFDHLIYLLATQQPDENEINEILKEYIEQNKKGTIENNREMVKLRRLKKPYWANLGNDGQPLYDKALNNSLSSIEEINTTETNLIEDTDFSKLNQNSKKKLEKNQDPSITNKLGFINTIHPRTQHDSENFSDELLDHHIVVCGIGPNLKNLIMPLRARSIKEKCRAILIMDKSEHIPSELWKEIQYFPDIYYMQGNAIKSEDLKKAGVHKAEAVIILSNNFVEKDQEDMRDADTIFIYKAIKNEAKKTLIIADISSVNSIGYISVYGDENIESQGFWLSEAFASGELYISSMLDTLICQTFFNPYLLSIIQQLILGDASFKFPLEIMKKLKEKRIIQSSLYFIKIKDFLDKYKIEYYGKRMKFEILFGYFLDRNMIPIGIFKNPEKITKNNQKFVFLAPSKNTLVEIEQDKIYVICNEDDDNHYVNIANQNDYILSNMRLVENFNELSIEFLNELKKTVEDSFVEFRNELSVKDLVNCTRSNLRNEFANVHQQKEAQIIKKAKEEFEKEIEEKGNESNEESSESNSSEIKD